MKKLAINHRNILQMAVACVAVLGALTSGSVQADPSYNEYTVNGTSVVGSGTNTTSAYFLDPDATGYTIKVNAGANLGNTTDQGNSNEIEFNHGSVTNAGTLSATMYGIDIHGNATINNSGAISGDGDAIHQVFTNSGTIGSANNFTLTNSGTISSNQEGVRIEQYNNGNSGINSNAVTVVNSGTIATSEAGFDLWVIQNQGNTGSSNINTVNFVNTGTITSTDNDGIILDDPFNGNNTGDATNIMTVTNSGAVNADADAMDIEAYNDSNGGKSSNYISLVNTGALSATNGEGFYVEDENSNGTGTLASTNVIAVTNSGSIQSHDAGMDLEQYTDGNTSLGSNTLTLTNSGSITSSENGGIFLDSEIYQNTATGTYTATISINNSGAIQSSGDGIEVELKTYQNLEGIGINNLNITNTSSINVIEADGIDIDHINNEGNLGAGANTNTATVYNNASIATPNGEGIYINSDNENNNGTGVSNVAITLGAKSMLTSYDEGIDVKNDNEVNDGAGLNSNTVAFTNLGSITSTNTSAVEIYNYNKSNAGDASNSIKFINTGAIQADDGEGVNLLNDNENISGKGSDTISFANYGSITSAGSYGADLENDDGEIMGAATGSISVTNGAGATISSNEYGLLVYNSGANYTAKIYNAGTISGTNFGVYLESDNAKLITAGGTISGGTDAIYLDGIDSNVTIQGRSTILGTIEGNSGDGNTLTFNLAGMTPAQIAAAKAAIAAADGGENSFVAGTKTYDFDGFQAGNITFNGISFAQTVDSGLRDLGGKLDLGTLPESMDLVYSQGANNPEATLNQLSGREFLNAFSQIGLSNATEFASQADSRAFALRSGSTGIDFSALNLSPSTMIASLGNMQNALSRMSSMSLLGGTSMSDSKDDKAMISSESPRWGAWAAGTVTFADESATSTSPGYNATSGSPTFGVDYRVCPELVVGALFNYTTGGVNFGDGSNLDTDTYLGGIYVDWTHKGWFVNGLAAGGKTDYNQNRTTLGGAQAQGSPSGSEELATLSTGYDFKVSGFIVSPEVGLQYTHLNKDAFSESGAGAFNLNVGEQDVNSLRTKLGLNLARPFTFSGIKFIPQANAFWYHECLDVSNGVTNSLAGAPGIGSFVVQTNPEGRDFALVGAGLNATPDSWHGNVSFFANYNAQVGQTNFIAQTVDAGVRIGF